MISLVTELTFSKPPVASMSAELTQICLLSVLGIFMVEPSGSTVPACFHGPVRLSAVVMEMPEAVEKRKYLSSAFLCMTNGSRASQSPEHWPAVYALANAKKKTTKIPRRASIMKHCTLRTAPGIIDEGRRERKKKSREAVEAHFECNDRRHSSDIGVDGYTIISYR